MWVIFPPWQPGLVRHSVSDEAGLKVAAYREKKKEAVNEPQRHKVFNSREQTVQYISFIKVLSFTNGGGGWTTSHSPSPRSYS